MQQSLEYKSAFIIIHFKPFIFFVFAYWEFLPNCRICTGRQWDSFGTQNTINHARKFAI